MGNWWDCDLRQKSITFYLICVLHREKYDDRIK